MINCAALVIKQKSCSAHVTFQIMWNSMASVHVFLFFFSHNYWFSKVYFCRPLVSNQILSSWHSSWSILMAFYFRCCCVHFWKCWWGMWWDVQNNWIIWFSHGKKPWSQLSLAAPCSSTAQGNWLQFLFGLQNFIQSDEKKGTEPSKGWLLRNIDVHSFYFIISDEGVWAQ